MTNLAKSLKSGTFTITAEIAPPKGVDPSKELQKRELLKEAVAINVTDNQGANMRMAPIAAAALLHQLGVEPVLQLTCRDRNRMALQSDLLGAAALGINNLLALSGDHSCFGDHPDSKPVFDLDSVQLLQVIAALNSGVDMNGEALDSSPSFFTGAAVAPSAQPFELMYQKFLKKIDVGASFFQTQAVFDQTEVDLFMNEASSSGTPVILGVLLLKSARMARFLNDKVPGVKVPSKIVDILENSSSPLEEGITIAQDMVAVAREKCAGVHMMTLGREDLFEQLIK